MRPLCLKVSLLSLCLSLGAQASSFSEAEGENEKVKSFKIDCVLNETVEPVFYQNLSARFPQAEWSYDLREDLVFARTRYELVVDRLCDTMLDLNRTEAEQEQTLLQLRHAERQRDQAESTVEPLLARLKRLEQESEALKAENAALKKQVTSRQLSPMEEQFSHTLEEANRTFQRLARDMGQMQGTLEALTAMANLGRKDRAPKAADPIVEFECAELPTSRVRGIRLVRAMYQALRRIFYDTRQDYDFEAPSDEHDWFVRDEVIDKNVAFSFGGRSNRALPFRPEDIPPSFEDIYPPSEDIHSSSEERYVYSKERYKERYVFSKEKSEYSDIYLSSEIYPPSEEREGFSEIRSNPDEEAPFVPQKPACSFEDLWKEEQEAYAWNRMCGDFDEHDLTYWLTVNIPMGLDIIDHIETPQVLKNVSFRTFLDYLTHSRVSKRGVLPVELFRFSYNTFYGERKRFGASEALFDEMSFYQFKAEEVYWAETVEKVMSL